MIAIAPPNNQQELQNYIDWLEFAGFTYKVLEKDEDATQYSALLLTGGADVGKVVERDEQEFKWFKMCYGNIPILGICRGMQLANIALGGTLHADLTEDVFIKHTSNKKLISEEVISDFPSSWHKINFEKIDFLKEDNQEKWILVNSRHHQGVDQIPDSLNIVATSEIDGLVEALENKHCLLVQWHPERLEASGKPCSEIVIEWLKVKIKGKDFKESTDSTKKKLI